jgi:REP element-mobilizing transposase RayT
MQVTLGAQASCLPAIRTVLRARKNDAAKMAALPAKTMTSPKQPLSPCETFPGAQASRLHKGWYSRGYLPHFDSPGLVQMVTFRLHDAMPASRRAEWEDFLKITDDATRREKIEAYLDAGHGSCALRDACIARLVEKSLLHFDGQRYRLLAWVVMPNHTHVLIETFLNHSLSEVTHSWKSFTAKQANVLLGRNGTFWQAESFDRFIRDEQHLVNAIQYIHDNPVKAELILRAEDWPYSSARKAKENAGKTPALPGKDASEA